MSSGVQRRNSGAVNGTGNLINVRTVGFRPEKVRLMNVDGDVILDWNKDFADDAGFKQQASAFGLITADGVIPLSDGFSIGTDSDVNVAAELIHWEAWE